MTHVSTVYEPDERGNLIPWAIVTNQTISIIFDPHGEIEHLNGDNEDDDEDREVIDMNLKKEALITESKIFLESGRLEEEKLLVWNRLPGFNFVLVFFSILIIVIFCHLSLLCLKMALDGLKLIAAINI